VLIEAISCITFVSQAVALSTGGTVLSQIMALPCLHAKLAFMHLGVLSVRGNFGDIIFDEEVQNPIGIGSRPDYILPRCNWE
jgi:hypothetical protein